MATKATKATKATEARVLKDLRNTNARVADLDPKKVSQTCKTIVGAIVAGTARTSDLSAKKSALAESIEKARKDLHAADQALGAARVTVMDKIVNALTGVKPVSEEVFDRDWRAPLREMLLASKRYTDGSVSAMITKLKTAIVALTAGTRRLKGEELNAYVTRATSARNDAKPAGTKTRGRAKGARSGKVRVAGTDKGRDMSPMDYALALTKSEARAKVLIVILKEHASAFDAWAADVLSK